MGVLQRYAKSQEVESESGSGSVGKGLGINVFQMCGTADILHPQALRLDEALRSFGKEVVRPELIVVSSPALLLQRAFMRSRRMLILIMLSYVI
jgi:hypothetical protein